MSRIEVPCRAVNGNETEWIPAYRVYFGRDWIGDDSIEDLGDAMAFHGEPMDVKFLASPSEFDGYADLLGVSGDTGRPNDAPSEADDEEVDLEDDSDQVLETTTLDRWRNFFSWLGVNSALRLVPFHDVEDVGAGWTKTKGFAQPGGWAFAGLGDVWAEYRTQLEGQLRSDPRWSSTDHYLYDVHSLDQFDLISSLASSSDTPVAERLFVHLVRNWRSFADHTRARTALVGAGKWPGSRSRPPRATSDELALAGPDLWLHRLHNHAVCPTSRGPRRPAQTWRQSKELERRFGRGGRVSGQYLPVLSLDAAQTLPEGALRNCLDELQVKGDMTPTSFTVDDARELCTALTKAYEEGVSEAQLRSDIRPVYRQMFELLVGSAASDGQPLADESLAAYTSGAVKFLPAHEVVYASMPGSRERSGLQGRVPIFILEAEPGAATPLRTLFGVQPLEESVEWSVSSGDHAFDSASETAFRRGLLDLFPSLLARLGADRPERRWEDSRDLRAFIESAEPVDALTLRVSFRNEDLGEVPQRSFFVRRQGMALQVFLKWGEQAWPPVPEDAQTLAMALAEAMRVNAVETFLSFINADVSGRLQLLSLAGAAGQLDVVMDEESPEDDRATGIEKPPPALEATDGESIESPLVASVVLPVGVAVAARVPLYRFEDLLFDGDVIRVEGIEPTLGTHLTVPPTSGAGPGTGGSSPRAASGTDLTELDRLGMLITIGFEERRHAGRHVAVLPGDAPFPDAEILVVDVSSPAKIKKACEQSEAVMRAFRGMASEGVSDIHPGFDVLTLVDGEPERLIELKSSGLDSRVQAMSWNEWKTAGGSLRSRFWLYLAGNLRADLPNAAPFLRAVHDPFGTLAGLKQDDVIRRQSIQLRVREFRAADELKIEVRRRRDNA